MTSRKEPARVRSTGLLENSGATAEEVSLNILDSVRDSFREMRQRWNEQLAFENLDFSKKYIEGWIGGKRYLLVVVRLNIVGQLYDAYFAAASHVEREIGKTPSGDDAVQASESSDGKYRRQEAVFVDNVQCVKTKQGVIPSFVRLYVVRDNPNDDGLGSLYYSVAEGFYEFLPCLPYGEGGVLRWNPPRTLNQFPCQVIEGSTQIMDNISNEQRDIFRRLFCQLEGEKNSPLLRVFLDVETIEARLEIGGEPSFQVLDVLFGPFDL